LLSFAHSDTGKEALTDDDVSLYACREHWRFTYIRQRVPLLVMMQQSVAQGAGTYRFDQWGDTLDLIRVTSM